ncbi:MAG TPA: FAD-binding and (Fe-S)-binding domain-containing protein [Bacteroidales bacterium]|jgi:D-lactate dehydrogenase|nr:FAD-binding and (Fe-S)-binding domain-containing protein [Bacteroidales bacterium]
MLAGKYSELHEKLTRQIDKSRIYHDPLYTRAYGTDASFYRLIPELVIKAFDEDEVSFILRQCSDMNIPVTFRAAGTSLSGQAITDSVLLVAAGNWKKYRINEDGSRIILQPGLTGAVINSLLAPYGRKIGPDPASINAATIGGIIANNASGMSSGTGANAYNTIESLRLVFADGTVLDTGNEESRKSFSKSHQSLINDILNLSGSVRDNVQLAERIRHKYILKNTTGYSLNALTDFTDPFQIIKHLIIGSEGTLAFISEVTMNTVVEHRFRASSLMIFPDLEKACTAVALLGQGPVTAAELIDRAGLAAVADKKGMPGFLKDLSPGASALLVETSSDSRDELTSQIDILTKAIGSIPVEIPVSFTGDPAKYAVYWDIRKGLFPSVGARRREGTTVIIEDVAFPVEKLAGATADLQQLLKKSGYDDAVIYGHALEGNLHFIFSQDFSREEEINRYRTLMDEVADLVTGKYDGSLKAEHGTGRNVAPFVAKEWGQEAYSVMQRIKQIFDPKQILNPGVILNSDPEVHLKNLKPMPPAHESIDKCIECGFCEPSCVSADLTLTPRQRISVFREITRLAGTGHEPHLASSLVKAYAYAGDYTCATDGLCAITCPVNIDTGKLIKHLRLEKIGNRQKLAGWLARNMNIVTAAARTGLNTVSFFHRILGTQVMKSIAGSMRKLSGKRIPMWNPYMPGGAKKINVPATQHEPGKRKVVYFPSCINRSMGTSADHHGEIQLTEKMKSLLEKGGYEIIYPDNLDNLCCGMAFLSKGYRKAGEMKSAELESALMQASNNGEYPVLCDMSPCLFTMKDNFRTDLKLYEPVEFITKFLLHRLELTPLQETVTVFPVCSMKKMGLDDMLTDLARRCAADVITPDTNCCGFAGDRGFTFPELNRHGLRNLRSQIPGNVRNGYSTSRTCEIGLSLHSGISHKSIVYLVDEVSRPKNN